MVEVLGLLLQLRRHGSDGGRNGRNGGDAFVVGSGVDNVVRRGVQKPRRPAGRPAGNERRARNGTNQTRKGLHGLRFQSFRDETVSEMENSYDMALRLTFIWVMVVKELLGKV